MPQIYMCDNRPEIILNEIISSFTFPLIDKLQHLGKINVSIIVIYSPTENFL